MTQLQMILFLCPIFFFTSFVDAVSGGGGLVALPAYLFTGMPVHSAYACNKVDAWWEALLPLSAFGKMG